ncbi:LamG-like jellyroll fold domain-containing protein [Flavobacterium faecale]|uniref:LamG-like jellyroll fold domain-containing protein n=1 Tax=Flavobacterium faecale TaxID=1355330 RepID=UPI003AAD66D7
MKKITLLITILSLCSFSTNYAQTANTANYQMYFSFDDNLTDTSGKAVVLNPKTAAVVDTYIAGKFGKAALFDDKPYITSNSTWESGNSYSILMWVKFNSLTSALGTPKIIHQEDIGSGYLAGRPLQLATPSAPQGIRVNTSFGEVVTNSSANPVVDTWIHVAIVMDKTAETVKMYINGVEDVSTTIGNNLKVSNFTNNAQLSIGVNKASTTTGLLNAYIDDFVITSEVLSATTINNIMLYGAATGGAQLGTSDIVAQSSVVYPNPSNGIITVSGVEVTSLAIFNLLGVKIVSSNSQTIDTSTLAKGNYLLMINTDKGSTTKKISVN